MVQTHWTYFKLSEILVLEQGWFYMASGVFVDMCIDRLHFERINACLFSTDDIQFDMDI